MAYEWHKPLEGQWIRLSTFTFLTVIIGGACLLIPPFFLQGTIEPLASLQPYAALELEGRDIYIREGCNTCHSQQVRPFKTETDRYGPFSLAGEGIYDRPFLWGSRRTGPDLARVGRKYPDSWHWLHFQNPRDIEPRSNMPGFLFLTRTPLDLSMTSARMSTLRTLGHPYSDAEIDNAAADAQAAAAVIAESIRNDGIALSEVEAQSEAIAVIAYLQSLGHAVREDAVAAVGAGGAR
jgi:cytochrome c oxidase cbb3-type subunit I/II